MKYYRFEQLAVGREDSIETEVTFEDVARFTELSGDVSPIHVDGHFAQGKGLQGRVAHGALLAAYVSRFVGVHLPGANGLLQSLQMQFH